MLTVPGIINPVLFRLGPLKVHWYAFAYIVPLLFCRYHMVQPLAKLLYSDKSIKEVEGKTAGAAAEQEALLHQQAVRDAERYFDIYVLFGIVLGGRFGYVLLYQTHWLWSSPMHVLRVWDGGMSFHGGVIGFALACLVFARKHRINVLKLSDMMMLFVPLGLGLGRLANFINGELAGRITSHSWAVVFSRLDQMPRHPSPLYEAFLEGIVLFILLYTVRRYTVHKKGFLTGTFLVAYAVMRMIAEFFREPDAHIGYIWHHVTLGQLYCLPMIAFGILFILRSLKKTSSSMHSFR